MPAKAIWFCLAALLLMAGAGCSTVSISNLHTQVGQAGAISPIELAGLKYFALCSSNSNQPFTEMLVLDTVKNNLLARGFIQNEQNPDFLVLVTSNQNYWAESHYALFGVPGWYYPGFGHNNHWPGYRWPMLSETANQSRSYTVVKNYVGLSIVFMRPSIIKQAKVLSAPDPGALSKVQAVHPKTQAALPTAQASPLILSYEQAALITKADILWRGQGVSISSRNAFTTLSCLAAGILEEFPNSSNLNSKNMELTKCY